MPTHRLSRLRLFRVRRGLVAVAASMAMAAAPGCGNPAPAGPTQDMDLTNTVKPPGTTTGNTPLKLPVVTEVLQCQRFGQKIVVAATGGAAGITISLQGLGAAPYASMRIDKDTVSVGEISLKLPLSLDARTFETSNPMTWVTSDRAAELVCSIRVKGPDPFALFEGDLSCSTLPGGLRDVQAAAQFRAIPCP